MMSSLGPSKLLSHSKLLDDRTVKNIHGIMTYVTEQDWDWLIVCDGPERSGKTDLSLLALLVSSDDLVSSVESEIYEPILERGAWSLEGMISVIESTPRGTALLYAEAALLGREAMSKLNRRMVKVMTTVGMENRLYLWDFPRFRMLDPYIRNSRCRTRAHTFTYKKKRGYVTWWIRREVHTPEGESVPVWTPVYTSRFPDIKTLGPEYSELWHKWCAVDFVAKKAILREG